MRGVAASLLLVILAGQVKLIYDVADLRERIARVETRMEYRADASP